MLAPAVGGTSDLQQQQQLLPVRWESTAQPTLRFIRNSSPSYKKKEK